jgi:predicted Rossmann fold nucleotide-binding protein DprA/Smf involved in DNA uptake
MRIAIVGSRDFTDLEKVEQEVLKRVSIEKIEKVVSGGAKGADTLARKFAEKYNIPLSEFLPDWGKFGRGAGPMRNTLIVENSDIVFAFPTKDSKGTRDTIRKAQEKGKIVKVFEI